MKKLILMLTVMAMLLSFAACGSDTAADTEATGGEETPSSLPCYGSSPNENLFLNHCAAPSNRVSKAISVESPTCHKLKHFPSHLHSSYLT